MSLLAGVTAANAADAGAVDYTDANGAAGWACTSELSNYQGVIHAYREDGLFLGVIQANTPREQAVANLCGGNGNHGFGGNFIYDASKLDGKRYDINLYFIRADGSHFEVSGSPVRDVQFGTVPQPWVFQYVRNETCEHAPQWNTTNWLKTRTGLSSIRSCPQMNGGTFSVLRESFVEIGNPQIPSGSEVIICKEPNALSKISTHGWYVVSEYSSDDCVWAFQEQWQWNGQPTYYNVARQPTLRIKKY